MSVAPHSNQAPATTPPTTQSGSASGTGWPKLARGEIPSTWSKPAEVVTTVPSRPRSTLPVGPIVGIVVAIGTAAAVFVAMPDRDPAVTTSTGAVTTSTGALTTPNVSDVRSVAATSANAAASTIAATNATVANAATTNPSTDAATNAIASVGVADAIPAPPPTSSTTPDAVAPEDQGGDANADAATAGDVVTELPARKKAKGLTARGIASLRGGDVASAEPLLVRAVLVDPSLADAWRHLGIARAQLGDVEGARRAYRKYLELAPKAPDAAQVRAILAAP